VTSKIPVSLKKLAPKKPSSPEPVAAGQPPQSSTHSSKNLAPKKPISADPVAASQPPPPPPLTRQNPISSDTDSFLSTKEEIEGEEEEQPLADKSLFESATTTASRKNSNESDDSVITKKPDRSIFAAPIVGGVLGGKRRPVKKQDSSEIDSDSSFKIRRFEAKKGDDESITLGHEEISDVDSTDNEDTDKK